MRILILHEPVVGPDESVRRRAGHVGVLAVALGRLLILFHAPTKRLLALAFARPLALVMAHGRLRSSLLVLALALRLVLALIVMAHGRLHSLLVLALALRLVLALIVMAHGRLHSLLVLALALNSLLHVLGLALLLLGLALALAGGRGVLKGATVCEVA